MSSPGPAEPPAPREAGDRLFELEVPARPSLLKLVRAAVAEAAREAGCAPDSVYDLVTAVDEACQNVIRHTYGGDPEGRLILRFHRLEDRVVVGLIDFGPPVDPEHIRPRPLHQLRPGGLGTRLIQECVDEAAYDSPPEGAGNLLRLVKRIG